MKEKEIAEEDEMAGVNGGKKGGQEKEAGEEQRRADDAGARARGYLRG